MQKDKSNRVGTRKVLNTKYTKRWVKSQTGMNKVTERKLCYKKANYISYRDMSIIKIQRIWNK